MKGEKQNMNKLLQKVAKIFLGLSMAAGVGVAVGTNRKDVNSVFAATSSGSAEPGSGGKFSEAGWSNSGLGSKYSDGSAKFDGSGDNIYKTNLFSGTVSSNMTSLQVDVQYKINGTGAAANAVTIAPYVNGSYITGTTQTGFSSTSKTTKSVTVSSGLAGCTGFKLTYTKSSGNLGVYKVSWTATYTDVTKVLDSISLDTSAVQKTFTTGDVFDSSGLVTTAHYTVPASFPDATVTPTSISSPNMSSAGEKTITVSYTEGGVTKTATYKITVNDPRSVTGLTVYDGELNELADEDEITLTASSGSSISTNVMCEVTYSPSGSDGNVSITSASGAGFSVSTEDNETYTLTFSANGNHVITFEASEDDSFAITVTYIVSGLPNISYITDTLDRAKTGVTGTSYDSWNSVTDQSDAVYAGQSAGGNSSIQIRSNNSNSGIVTTTSGGVVTSITITFNSNTQANNTVLIFGKDTAYSDPTNLYNDSLKGTQIGSASYTQSEVTVDIPEANQKPYIGLRSSSGAIYMSQVDITWAVEQETVDVLENIFIDGSLTTSTYVEGQTISLEGLTVYGHYTTDGDVSLMGKTGLTFGCTPTTATSTSLDEITVNASYEGKNASETYEISVSADSVKALGWGTRGYDNGDYFLSGKTLSECIDTSKWTFDPTWASGLDKGTPTFGTGSDNVHVGLYASPTPSSETATALTNSYTFSTADDGKYLVAFYKGTHSTNNRQLFITESLNEVKKPAEGDPGYFLVKDATELSAGDTVVIAAANYNYAMSTTQNGNNRGAEAITKDGSHSSMNVTSSVELFTLEAGTESSTWAFKTAEGYIYAASSGSNYLRTKTEKDANCSFALTVSNTGVASLIAQGSNTRNVLSFNNGNTIFSCYSAIQGSGQVAIYKYTEPMDEPINNINLKVQHVVVEYAKAFNSSLEDICIAYGQTDSDDLSEAWSTLDSQFTNWFNGSTKSLTDDEKSFAKALFANAKYIERESESNDSLQTMLGKYDEILSHYDFDDFLKDDAGRAAAPQAARFNLLEVAIAKNNSIAIIVIISMVSLTAIGGYFFLRKRKENI